MSIHHSNVTLQKKKRDEEKQQEIVMNFNPKTNKTEETIVLCVIRYGRYFQKSHTYSTFYHRIHRRHAVAVLPLENVFRTGHRSCVYVSYINV